MRRLFKVTQNSDGELFVAANSLEHVARVYGNSQKLEFVSDKVMVLKDLDRAAKDTDEEDIQEISLWIERRNTDSLKFNQQDLNASNPILHYIERITHNLTDAELSNRGYQSTYEAKDRQIKELKQIIEDAIETEEKHYEGNESGIAGWITQAKEALK